MNAFWHDTFFNEKIPLLMSGYDEISWLTIYERSRKIKRFVQEIFQGFEEERIGTPFGEGYYILAQFDLWEVKNSSYLFIGNADRGIIISCLLRAWEVENKKKAIEKLRKLRASLSVMSPLLAKEIYNREVEPLRELHEIKPEELEEYKGEAFCHILNKEDLYFIVLDLDKANYPSYRMECTKEEVEELIYKMRFFGTHILVHRK